MDSLDILTHIPHFLTLTELTQRKPVKTVNHCF